ncbi:4Fe-4S cluster-binding domain-containing protein [Gracilibacillus salitolerans]|uniref:4Fe-4S cluster-binding domain-containing protein n=1 Tax=Gracilibacillus salitolerans TaxID=2663022 RepID=A0A5Q2TGD9_9BACI|nr:4Fe-4S cluster-binding domain-containing protein [Gracilibacillus salitolerans]QGH33202.1 4Fe-4S cluster-binding domain-containing protein [Gracilibacillus salitolerans]
MKFYNRFIRTFQDLPDHTTLLVHSLSGCLLHCYGCHNYDEIIANTPRQYKTKEDLYNYLEKSGFLFDAVMFSGGEFLIDKIEDITVLLEQVQSIFNGKIIVTTCGIYNTKIKHLIEKELVDGIHIDMKLPYHVLDPKEDQKIFQDIMGIKASHQLIENLLESIDTVIQHNSPLDQVRTVKYPILADTFFDEIRDYIEQRKSYFQSDVPYYLNQFQYV